MSDIYEKNAKIFAEDVLRRSGYDMRDYEPFLRAAVDFQKRIINDVVETIQSQSMNSGDEFETGLTMAENAILEKYKDV